MLTNTGRERWVRAYAEAVTKAEDGDAVTTTVETDEVVSLYEQTPRAYPSAIQTTVERAANVRARMEEDTLRAEVIKVLRAQGYTVIPPGEGS